MKLSRALARLRDRPRVAFGLTLAVGIVLSLAATLWRAEVVVRTAQLQFDTVARDVAERLAERLQTYEFVVEGARGVVLANGPDLIGKAPFERYVDSLDINRRFPGLFGIGLIWRVAPADEAAFVDQVRRGGNPEFAVRQLAPHDGDRYVSTYAAGRSAPRGSIGVDIASGQERREVAERAMRSGATSFSAPLRLIGASGTAQHSVLLMLPIYRAGSPVSTAQERTAATVGWIVSALAVEQALASLGLDDRLFSVSLEDRAGPVPIFHTAGAEAAAAEGIAQRIELPVYGRAWTVEVRARPLFLQQLNQPDPRAIGAFGVLLSAALAMLMHALAQSRRRGQQVRNEQARHAAIVAGSNDAIICGSMDGVVTDWNAGAERLFGHTAADVIGQPLAELLVPQGREAEFADVHDRMTRGESVPAFDTVLRHRDGSLLDVSLAASPILAADGHCVGVAKTVRDISAARRAAGHLRELNASLERRVAERTSLLEAARHDLQAILDALPTAIAYWDKTLHNRFRNRAHQEWFVGDPARGTGTHMSELLGDDYKSRLVHVQAALRGEARTFEHTLPIPLTGDQRHAVVHYLPDTSDGEVQGFYVMAHDVTAARLAERRLQASEEFLDRAGEIAGVGGWALDLRTMALHWSAHTFRIHELGSDQQPDIGAALDFYPAEVRPVLSRAIEQAIACGTPWDLELPFVTARGRHLWVRSQGAADVEGGKAVRLVGAFQDISERKRIAARLEQSLERFAIAADSARIGVWEYEPASASLVWDERMYRLYGQPPAGRVEPYSLWATSLHPGDRAQTEAALQAALRGDEPYDLDFRIVWPNGEVRHLHANARVVRDAQGAALRMTGVNIDITEQKRAELDLVETSSLLHTLLESASQVSIIATDPLLKVAVFNAGAGRLLGYAADEIVGRAAFPLIHDSQEVEARAAELSAQLGRPVEGGAVFTEAATLGEPREWTYVRKDGSRVRVSLVVTAMRSTEGSLLGYLGIAHDVTRQNEYEETLRDATRKARHASVAKSEFLANMSHEIRTPMNAVIGLTYLLGQSTLNGQQADMVDKLRVAGKSLLGIINDVLDLSKIEAGELLLEKAPFTLRGVLKDLKGLMSLQASSKGIRLSIEAAGDLPAVLEGDATRLGQVLTNLVANAIKFTDRGGVKLSVARCAGRDGDDSRDDRVARLRFTVRDSGIGIAPDVQARLFSPFVQADSSTNRRFGGTGLGLSIVKRLVLLMGGSVGLESEPGIGSTFWVELALALPDASPPALEAPATPHSPELQGVRVLITDDSDINLEVASRILMRHGAQITLAHDGQQAIDLLKKRPDAFDVVLMDMQMPVLDGHEATHRIRNQLGLTTLPIIALSAGALTHEQQGARAAGLNDFVRKPFEPQSLVRTVRRHLRPLAALPAPVGPEDAAAAPSVRRDDWPEIAGIETADVRTRLGGDVNLFGSMLRRLLKEFAEIGRDLDDLGTEGGAALDALSARLHKLKGSAGTLGARTISQLAHRAEAACRNRRPSDAREGAQELAAQLKALSEDASRVLDRLQATDGGDGRGLVAAPVESAPRRLSELITLLKEQSMSALDRFADLSPHLRQRLGDDIHRQLREQIGNLQFDEALRLLGPLANDTASR